MSICSYQTCSPTCDKFAGCRVKFRPRNFHLPPLLFFRSPVYPQVQVDNQVFPYFFHLILRTLGRLVFLQEFSRGSRVRAHTHTHTLVSPSLNVSTSLSGKERRVEERKSKWECIIFMLIWTRCVFFNVVDHSEQAWSLRDIRIQLVLASFNIQTW